MNPGTFAGIANMNTTFGTTGIGTVSRTGYNERDLMDYDAESVKLDIALHYRPFANDVEIIFNVSLKKFNFCQFSPPSVVFITAP